MSDVGVNMVMKIVDEIKKEVRLENIKDPHAINDIIVDKMFVIYANDSYMTTKINYAENELNSHLDGWCQWCRENNYYR